MAEGIVCKRCGAENTVGATMCWKCMGSLSDAEPPAVTPVRIVGGRGGWEWGGVVAIAVFLVLLVVAGWVVFSMQSAGKLHELSAVQVTQLYTMGIFWILLAIGVGVAGILYVVSEPS